MFKKESRIPVHLPKPFLVYQAWAGTPSLSKEDFLSNLEICNPKPAFNPLLIKEFIPSHNSDNDRDLSTSNLGIFYLRESLGV